MLIALGLLATDALTRLRPGPVLRVATLVIFLAATLTALGVRRARRRTAAREETFYPQGESNR